MRQNLYTVYDNTAEEIFGGIVRANNDEVARRTFHEALGDQNSPLAKNAKDYTLIRLGSIDTFDGAISAAEPPQAISTGADWLAANKEA